MTLTRDFVSKNSMELNPKVSQKGKVSENGHTRHKGNPEAER